MIETISSSRPNYRELVNAAAKAGHVDPEWLASCLFHAVKAGMSVDDAIDQWRRAEPEKFIGRRNVLR